MPIQTRHSAVIVNQHHRSPSLCDSRHHSIWNITLHASHLEKEGLVCLGVEIIASLTNHHAPDVLL